MKNFMTINETDRFKAFMISLLFITALLATITIFYADFNDKYTSTNYYEENLTSIQNSLENTTYYLEQTKEGIDKLTGSGWNIYDIIGGLKQTGLSLIKSLGSSINGGTKIFSQGISIFGIGLIGSVWILVAGAAIILMFIFWVIERIT